MYSAGRILHNRGTGFRDSFYQCLMDINIDIQASSK
jgi:hypothetical protein